MRLSPVLQPLTHDLLSAAPRLRAWRHRVNIGEVEEVDPQFRGTVQQVV